jgi:hypothetical protein
MIPSVTIAQILDDLPYTNVLEWHITVVSHLTIYLKASKARLLKKVSRSDTRRSFIYLQSSSNR